MSRNVLYLMLILIYVYNLENELETSSQPKQSESKENMRPIPAARKKLFDLNTESRNASNNDIELQNIDSSKTYHTSPPDKIDIENCLNDGMSCQTPVTQQHKPAPPPKPKKLSLTQDSSEQQAMTHEKPSITQVPNDQQPQLTHSELSVTHLSPYEQPTTSDEEPSVIRHHIYEKPQMSDEKPYSIRRHTYTYIQAMYDQPDKEQEALDKVKTPSKTSTNLTRSNLDTKPKPKKRLKTAPLSKKRVPENDEASKQNDPWYDHQNGSRKIKGPINTDSILSTKGYVIYMETMPEIVNNNDFYCYLFFYRKI